MSGFEPYLSGYEHLQPSRLSNQLEALGDEIDLTSLNFQVTGLNLGDMQKVATSVRNSVTAASIARTTQGASVLTTEIEDPQLALLNSGIFGSGITLTPDAGSALATGVTFTQNLDVEIDGLYFRLVSVDKPDPDTRNLTLQFEDREVNVLRSYPRLGLSASDPNPNAYKLFAPSMSRSDVMRWLVSEAKEYGPHGLLPRLVVKVNGDDTPANGPQKRDTVKSAIAHDPGFPPPPYDVTVKGKAASAAQIATLNAVLSCGWQMRIRNPMLLQAAVMVVTQESNAGTASSNVFQQEATEGWPASGDPTTDAQAFFDHLTPVYAKNPGATPGLLAALVQRPLKFNVGLDPAGGEYGQWALEASHTVGVWTGASDDLLSPNTKPGALVTAPAGSIIGTGSFKRGAISGQGGAAVVEREDNWKCLQRLASEVGWVCYCVSGTIYIKDWPHIIQQATRFQFSEDSPGINGIGIEIDTGMANATATVNCRISRWGAPPGTLVKLNDIGPGSGRWVVQTIERDIFTTAGTITLNKPQVSLLDAQSATPIQGIPILTPSGQSTAGAAKVIEGDVLNVRAAIVAAAQAAFARNWPDIQYSETAPTRSTETSLARSTPPPIYADCSSFVTLCYEAAGAPDPNGQGYKPLGDTASLIANGTKTTNPQPGDLLFYGSLPKPSHVQMWIGNNTVIQMGRVGQGVQRESVIFSGDVGILSGDGAAGPAIGFYTYNLGPLAKYSPPAPAVSFGLG